MAIGDKIKRKMLATYLNSAFAGNEGGGYVLIGKGIDEMSVSMGANVTKTPDILGETPVTIDKYEKSQSVEPYYAREGDELFEALQAVIDGDLTLDDLNSDIIDVNTWEAPTSETYPAIKEECVIEVVSYGGNTEGYQIPFNIHRTGIKTSGMFNPTTKTFTANS